MKVQAMSMLWWVKSCRQSWEERGREGEGEGGREGGREGREERKEGRGREGGREWEGGGVGELCKEEKTELHKHSHTLYMYV